jgi:hypothetical protein
MKKKPDEITPTREEIAELWEEIERLRGEQKKTFFNHVSNSLKNTFKSPVTTIIGVAVSAPLIYKGFTTNNNELISLGLGNLATGVLTNENSINVNQNNQI